MKKTSKLITLILALSLVLCSFGITAGAEGTATVTVASVQASAGETVAVEVTLSDCAKFSSYTVNFTYDSEYVTAVTAKKGINTMLYMPNLTVNNKKEVTIQGGSIDNITENGVIATVYFQIAEDYPGGVTEVPLKITKCKLTEYNGKNDVEFASLKVDGKLVISGAGGSVIWNGGEGESEITPAKLTDEEAAEYTNPLTNEGVSGGEYYVNEETKIAIPAADVEAGVKNDPDNFKVVEHDKVTVPEGSDAPIENLPDDVDVPSDLDPEGGITSPTNWPLIIGISAGAGGLVVIAGIVILIVFIGKKKKAKK